MTHLVLIVWVEIYAALLGTLPVCGDASVDVRLVDDLGNQLRSSTDGTRVRRRQFGLGYSVLAAVNVQEADEDPDMLYGEAQQEDGGYNEENDAFAHGCCVCCCLLFRGLGGRNGDQGRRGREAATAGGLRKNAVEIESSSQTVMEQWSRRESLQRLGVEEKKYKRTKVLVGGSKLAVHGRRGLIEAKTRRGKFGTRPRLPANQHLAARTVLGVDLRASIARAAASVPLRSYGASFWGDPCCACACPSLLHAPLCVVQRLPLPATRLSSLVPGSQSVTGVLSLGLRWAEGCARYACMTKTASLIPFRAPQLSDQAASSYSTQSRHGQAASRPPPALRMSKGAREPVVAITRGLHRRRRPVVARLHTVQCSPPHPSILWL